jgi:hypothetical protein
MSFIRNFSFLLTISITVPGVFSQERSTEGSLMGQVRSVVNEDQGKACILTGDVPFTARKSVKAVSAPQQYSLFVGRGWTVKDLRKRESSLANLLTPTADQGQAEVMERLGIKGAFTINNFEEVANSLAGGGALTDLKIQSIIGERYRKDPGLASGDNTVFVIYLDPSTSSTLGDMSAAKHYMAYHNGFYAAGVKLRYVVAPYQEDLAAAARLARAAFLSAALDPECGP